MPRQVWIVSVRSGSIQPQCRRRCATIWPQQSTFRSLTCRCSRCPRNFTRSAGLNASVPPGVTLENAVVDESDPRVRRPMRASIRERQRVHLPAPHGRIDLGPIPLRQRRGHASVDDFDADKLRICSAPRVVADGIGRVRHLDSTPIRIDDVVNAQSAFTQDGRNLFGASPARPVPDDATDRQRSRSARAQFGPTSSLASDRQRSAPSPCMCDFVSANSRIRVVRLLMTCSACLRDCGSRSPRPERCSDRVDGVGFDVADRRVSHLVNRNHGHNSSGRNGYRRYGRVRHRNARGARAASRWLRASPLRARDLPRSLCLDGAKRISLRLVGNTKAWTCRADGPQPDTASEGAKDAKRQQNPAHGPDGERRGSRHGTSEPP